MGTPEFAVPSLKALLDEGMDVVAVVTAPDRPAGRGQKLKASPVKAFALSRDIPVLQPTNLKDDAFLDQLRKLGVNLAVVVAFRMLPEKVWSLPELGTFNLHASLLPDYRGAAPINWALINGESRTGVTTFFIDEKIDMGHIIFQESLAIGPEENAGELHDRLMSLGSQLVVRTARAIANEAAPRKPQKHLSTPKNAPKLDRDTCRIAWDQPATAIRNLIRGLSPYPGAWSRLENDGETLHAKILTARHSDRDAEASPGTIYVESGRLWVQASDTLLELTEIQLEGRRRMPVKDLLNGYYLNKDARFL